MATLAETDSQFAAITRVCIMKVFDQLPLTDLFSCAAVNRHWRSEVFIYCPANVHTLAILTPPVGSYPEDPLMLSEAALITNEDGSRTFPENESIKWNMLPSVPDGFSIKPARLLTNLFPQLSKLVFLQEILNDSVLNGLLHLLSHSTTTLTSFTLRITKFQLPTAAKASRLRQLFNHINALSRLERLALEFKDELEPPNVAYHRALQQANGAGNVDNDPNPYDLPVIGWLHELQFACMDRCDILAPSLLQYGPKNARLRSIAYETGHLVPEAAIRNLLRYATNDTGRLIAPKFTSLLQSHAPLEISIPELSRIVQSFTSLACLYLNVTKQSWKNTIRALSGLSSLIELNCYIRELSTESVTEDVELWPELPALRNRLRPLTSVRVLTFYVGVTVSGGHQGLESFTLGQFFPRIQVLKIDFNEELDAPEDRHGIKHGCAVCYKAIEDALPSEDVNQDWLQTNEEAFDRCGRACIGDWLPSGTLKKAILNSFPIELPAPVLD